MEALTQNLTICITQPVLFPLKEKKHSATHITVYICSDPEPKENEHVL